MVCEEIDELLDGERFDEALRAIERLDGDLRTIYFIQYHLRRGDYPSADKVYRERPLVGDDPNLRMKYCVEVGDLHQKMGRNSEGREMLKRSLDIYDGLPLEVRRGATRPYANTLNRLGLIEMSEGNYTESLRYFEKAYALQEGMNYPYDRISLLNNIGLIRMHREEYDASLGYFTRGLELARELGDRKKQAALLNNIGIVNRKLERWHDALSKNFEALEITREIGNRPVEAQILNSIGAIYHEMGQVGDALDFFEKSLRIKEDIGNSLEIGIACFNIASMYLENGDFREATEYFDRAIAIKEVVENNQLRFYILESRSIMARYRGEYESAFGFLQRAIDIQKDLGNRENLARSYYSLAGIYRLMGKDEEALSALSKSRNYLQDSPRHLILSDILLLSVIIHVSRGELVEGQRALTELEQIANETGSSQIDSKKKLAESVLLIAREPDSSEASELLMDIIEDSRTSMFVRTLALQYMALLLVTLVIRSPTEHNVNRAKDVISQIHELAERRSSYAHLVESLILQSKLSSALGDIDGARSFTMQAREIAEKQEMSKAIEDVLREEKRLEESHLPGVDEVDSYLRDLLRIKYSHDPSRLRRRVT